MKEILKVLEQNSKFTEKQIASMLGMEEADVAAAIQKYMEDGTLLGYTALVDWDKLGPDMVTALIEVKIAPQRGDGFDRIAERIYQYDEVESLYLMSGSFDFAVMITGKSLQDIAQFVFARLAPIEGVTSTATHFILKKYKEKHHLYKHAPVQEEGLLFT